LTLKLELCAVRGFLGGFVRGFFGSSVRGFFDGFVRGFFGSSVRGFFGSSVRGFFGSSVRGFFDGFVRSFFGSSVRSFFDCFAKGVSKSAHILAFNLERARSESYWKTFNFRHLGAEKRARFLSTFRSGFAKVFAKVARKLRNFPQKLRTNCEIFESAGLSAKLQLQPNSKCNPNPTSSHGGNPTPILTPAPAQLQPSSSPAPTSIQLQLQSNSDRNPPRTQIQPTASHLQPKFNQAFIRLCAEGCAFCPAACGCKAGKPRTS
jgi:hypothetical protein